METGVSKDDDVKVENVPLIEEKENVKESPKEEAKIPEGKAFENVEENIKNLIQNGYENVREFVDSNGGVQNLFAIFKDDIVSLKNNVCHAMKNNFNHCGKKIEQFYNSHKKQEKKEKKEKKAQASIEEFKKDLEESIDKMFTKMKGKLVNKMVKKYAKLTGEEVEEVAVHHGVTCDGCEVSPIRGIRYKCTGCRDFDFCENCEKNVKHNPEHHFKKIKKAIDYNKRRHHGGNWGHCWRRDRDQGQANQKPQQGQNEPVTHHGVRCDGCGVRPLRGIRYKCNVCPNFDFCEKCKVSAAHPKEHSFNEITKPVDRFSTWRDIRENRCNFFKNLFSNNFPNQNTQPENKTEVKPEVKPQEHKEESGFDFLVKEMKDIYQLHQLDDKLILEALKKANGDIEQALTVLFA